MGAGATVEGVLTGQLRPQGGPCDLLEDAQDNVGRQQLSQGSQEGLLKLVSP